MAEDPRAHHAQVPRALRGSPQEPSGQGGSLSVQEHLPAGMCVWRILARTSSLFVRKLEVRDYIYSVYICILLSGKYQITGGCG